MIVGARCVAESVDNVLAPAAPDRGLFGLSVVGA